MAHARVLFISDDHIESSDMSRTWHSFVKHPANPLVRPDRPWEGKVVYCYGTAMLDEGEYRWYYLSIFEPAPGRSRFAVCLATSRDGISWVKPELGAVDFAGSTANNIVMYDACIPSVIKLADEPDPQRRYRMLYWNLSGGPSGYYLALSPDGIHWRQHEGNPVWPGRAGGTEPGGPGDVINTFFDTATDRFVAFAKVRRAEVFGSGRIIARGESPDAISWSVPEVVLVPDERDPQGSTQFYGMAAFPYEDLYLGLLWVFHTDADTIDVQLAWSRDGRQWERSEARNAIIELGPEGSWDAGMILTVQAPVILDEEVRVYYSGWEGGHEETGWGAAMGLASMRRDGFVSMDAGERWASLLTTPMACGRSLLVNADCSGGELRAALVGGDGKPLPGCAATRCAPLRLDSLRHHLRWPGVELPVGEAVRVRVTARQTQLFSLWFE
ncbi:MAG: hypothetical protein AB7Y46_12300 [Armatimonadota bacterium]